MLLAWLSPGCETPGMSVTVLDREMYTEAAAARLLGVAQGTLNYWLEGRASGAARCTGQSSGWSLMVTARS